MQAQVTFVRHNPKQANGRNGTFTVHEFFTEDGTKFETTKTEIANAAYALLNQPVLVTYDERQNGEWTNRHLSAVQGAAAGAMAPGVLPSGSTEAPTGASTAQTAAPTTQSTGGAGTRTADHPDTAARIARSVGLESALKAIDLGVVTGVSSSGELFTLAGNFAKYVFDGSRPSSQAATGADSSGAGGGGEAGAAPAAPAPTSAPDIAPPADDDIPF